jgi:hypothetical protein
MPTKLEDLLRAAREAQCDLPHCGCCERADEILVEALRERSTENEQAESFARLFWMFATRFEMKKTLASLLASQVAPLDRARDAARDVEHLLDSLEAEFPEDLPLPKGFVLGG